MRLLFHGRGAASSFLRVFCRFFWTLFCTAVCQSQSEPIYHASADEVRVSFSALDRNHHGLPALEKSDFAVVDAGVVVRNFQSLEHEDWLSLELAILIDTSDSVRPQWRRKMNDDVDLITQTTQVADQRLALFSFHNSQPVLLCSGDCRPFPTDPTAHAARSGNLTPLFDTVVFAAQFLARRGDAHTERVLVVLSDGQDTISRSSLSDAIESARAGEVQVDCIRVDNSDSTRGAAVLRALADGTGGRAFSPEEGGRQAAESILESLHATYTVTYRVPSPAAGFHPVRVLPTHNLNLQFVSRNGYYIPDSSGPQGER
ncbi:MAG TPA: hypothetical protein VMH04_16030 [Candidatus Solibacter sp.]|nr:hypothetical protein [Candidatus Solibacter sp.]